MKQSPPEKMLSRICEAEQHLTELLRQQSALKQDLKRLKPAIEDAEMERTQAIHDARNGQQTLEAS